MTCTDHRVWLLSMVTMAVTTWTTAIFSLAVLIIDGEMTPHAVSLLFLWTITAPIPVTVHLLRWLRRFRTARRVQAMACEHARILMHARVKIGASLR